LELLLKSQGSRLDDQRVDFSKIRAANSDNHAANNKTKTPVSRTSKKGIAHSNKSKSINTANAPDQNQEGFMDLVARLQADRMDEQRCSLPELPGLVPEGIYPLYS